MEKVTVDFSDLDLDSLLEDYTCSELDTDDESDQKPSCIDKSVKSEKVYKCD